MAKKIIYIIPGLGENCRLSRYQLLAKMFRRQGYKVIFVNPDWYRPLSEQIFRIEKNAVVFGFSFGAVLAYLIAKKYPCRKAIFASMSPIHTFSFKSLVADYLPHMDKENAIKLSRDIKSIKISLSSLKTSYVTLVGEKEDLRGDIIVPSAGHFMDNGYIKCVCKLI